MYGKTTRFHTRAQALVSDNVVRQNFIKHRGTGSTENEHLHVTRYRFPYFVPQWRTTLC